MAKRPVLVRMSEEMIAAVKALVEPIKKQKTDDRVTMAFVVREAVTIGLDTLREKYLK